MSKNIVFEGWLTKSPPTKRIWRTKWRRRWFSLRQSGELPGQYFLDYYADRNCRRLKGTINLDLCEQVDAGLHMDRTGNGSLGSKLRGSVFTIQTQSRTYHLEADCEAEMEKWVDAICRVCGLRATEDGPSVLETHEINLSSTSTINKQYEFDDSLSPYIPISECITGVRAPDTRRAFTFDAKNIVMSTRTPFEQPDNKSYHMYMSQPHIRLNNTDVSENESNLSDDECKSLNVSQSNIRDWSVAKSFTKLDISPNRNGISEDGPPVPPRPPKTFAMSRDLLQKDFYQGSRMESIKNDSPHMLLVPRRMSHGAAPISPVRLLHTSNNTRHVNDRYQPGHASTAFHLRRNNEIKEDVLQYLDLDLHTSKPTPPKPQETPQKKMDIAHGKSLSAVDTDSAYKTVDFLKTEAFNITRQDAEASRNSQY